MLAIQRLEGSMKHLESGQFEMNLPFNGKLSMLQQNRELSIARTYKQVQDMAIKPKYRELAVKAKTELEVNNYIEKVSDDRGGKNIFLSETAEHLPKNFCQQ